MKHKYTDAELTEMYAMERRGRNPDGSRREKTKREKKAKKECGPNEEIDKIVLEFCANGCREYVSKESCEWSKSSRCGKRKLLKKDFTCEKWTLDGESKTL